MVEPVDIDRLAGLLSQTSLTLYESKEVYVGAGLLIAAFRALLADTERLTAENKRLRAVLGEDDIDTFLADELTDPAFAGAYLAARENSTAEARADAAEARLTQLRERAESEIADATVSESYHAEFNNGGELIGQQARRFAWETVVRLAAASVVSETGEKP